MDSGAPALPNIYSYERSCDLKKVASRNKLDDVM
jgi:hypothetical protein